MGFKNFFVSRPKLFLEYVIIPFNSTVDYPGHLT